MNTRNIQTFLMVSAAFFAMSAPVRSNPGSNEPGHALYPGGRGQAEFMTHRTGDVSFDNRPLPTMRAAA